MKWCGCYTQILKYNQNEKVLHVKRKSCCFLAPLLIPCSNVNSVFRSPSVQDLGTIFTKTLKSNLNLRVNWKLE